MALTFKTKGSDFKRLPAGTHIAVCDIVAAVGLGNFLRRKAAGLYPLLTCRISMEV